jgi:FAD-dependent urate hydroxylase
MNFAGMFGHFGDLTDLERWRFMRHILEELPVPTTQDGFWRCRRFQNFAWHANCAWRSARDGEDGVTVETNVGKFAFDYIIFATGVETDLSARSELGPLLQHIALWSDRFTPPPGEESDLLARHPYLGTAFEFTERQPGTAPFLGRLHNFTFGAMPSLGLTGAAIPGIKYGVRRLVNGLARDLFREDSSTYYEDLLTYNVPELETLESAFTWVSRLGSDAISSDKLINQLDPATLALFRGGLQSQHLNHESGAARKERTRAKRASSGTRPKGTKTQMKPRRRAKSN